MKVFKILKRPFVWYFELAFKKKIKVAAIALFSSVFIIFLGGLMSYLAVMNGVFGAIPSEEELTHLNNAEASEVYSSDDVLLGRYYIENRTDMKYEDVNPMLIKGLVVTEDARFYEHEGIDHISMVRVLIKSILLGQKKGGGSTLSQQLAKNVFGRKNYGVLTMPVNKLREMIIAKRMEKVYSKKEILMLYLNTVSFGEDTFGIGTASERFFSVSPQHLKTEEAAVLIGLLKSPTLYNPRTRPEQSKRRRNIVLHQMYMHHLFNEDVRDSLQEQPINLSYRRLTHDEGLATHFREHLRLKLEQWIEKHPKKDGTLYNLYTDGLTIKTTIHSKLQQYAEDAVNERLSELQPLLIQDLKAQKVFDHSTILETLLKKSNRYKTLRTQGLSEKEALKTLEAPVEMSLFVEAKEIDTLLSPADSLIHVLSQLQSGFLAVNPRTGGILAWVGGTSFQQNQYDHVLSKRQVGSIFKPIVYAQALRNGKSPCDYVSNQAVVYTEYENWLPEDSGEDEEEGNYSIAGALESSVNTVSVKLCMDAGIHNVISLAKSLGIEEEFPKVPSIALGAVETSLFNMVGAYTAFANNGERTTPQFITSITERNNAVIYNMIVEETEVLDKETSQQLMNMMQGVVNNGTAKRLRTVYGIKGDIAGKTGTTQHQQDGWFMGCTPLWVAGSWVGADYPEIHFSSIKNGQGANTALPIWAKFYIKIAKDPELKSFVQSHFSFKNTIDCKPFKEDGFFKRLFKRKLKKDKRTGLKKN